MYVMKLRNLQSSALSMSVKWERVFRLSPLLQEYHHDSATEQTVLVN